LTLYPAAFSRASASRPPVTAESDFGGREEQCRARRAVAVRTRVRRREAQPPAEGGLSRAVASAAAAGAAGARVRSLLS
jgi:hypothetical protein